MIASIVVDCKTDSVDRTFDYLVPPCFVDSIKIGQRVYVPFARQNLLGIVVGLKEESEYENLKEIYDILDLVPCLNEELIMLAKNMHEYYFSLYITCLLTMIPQAIRVKYEKVFEALDSDALPLDIRGLFFNNKFVISLFSFMRSNGYFRFMKPFNISFNSLSEKVDNLFLFNSFFISPKVKPCS